MSTQFVIPDWLPREPAPPPPPVDDHRVEGLVNRFIAGKQQALFTAPDAFYHQQGADAVDGASAIGERLQALRSTLLDQARDDGERAALGPRLDAHIDEAMDGIGRHVEAQHKVWQRQVVAERQSLIQRAAALEHDNDGKIAGLAEAHASAAQELARLDGIAPGSPEETDVLNAARSQILRAAIEHRIGAALPDKAVTLYDRMKDTLLPADRQALEVPIGAAADEAATDAWLAREGTRDGATLAERAGLDDTLSAQQRLILQFKIAARESAEKSDRFATVKGLDDRRDEATAAIAIQPSAYRIGTLAALAEAYDAAGASEQAAETRRLALLERFFLPFAQLGITAQQRHLETLTGPERAMAEAIMSHQADAFARDPYAAGTALYPEVGPLLPEEDADGRLAQVRMIELRRGVPVPIRKGDEIAAPEHESKLTSVNLSPEEEARAGRALSDPRSDVASGDGQIAQAEPMDPTSTASRRGVAPPIEPPPNDPATEDAFQDFGGENLLLSNGKWVVDPNSPTGYVTTPFKDDLKSVAAAARRAKAEHPDWDLSQSLLFMDKKTRDELEAVLRANLGQGGTFDYQRRRYSPGKDGLTQLRQFRSIANINVGLFCQQLGLSLDQTLSLAGYYAVQNSSNRSLLRPPYFLDSNTRKYIETGYEVAAKKLFE
jgi:hypothetical protein